MTNSSCHFKHWDVFISFPLWSWPEHIKYMLFLIGIWMNNGADKVIIQVVGALCWGRNKYCFPRGKPHQWADKLLKLLILSEMSLIVCYVLSWRIWPCLNGIHAGWVKRKHHVINDDEWIVFIVYSRRTLLVFVPQFPVVGYLKKFLILYLVQAKT